MLLDLEMLVAKDVLETELAEKTDRRIPNEMHKENHDHRLYGQVC